MKALRRVNFEFLYLDGYLPKQESDITISKTQLKVFIKEHIFSTGKLFNPDIRFPKLLDTKYKEVLGEVFINKENMLQNFAEHHSYYLYKHLLD
jgi:hypothetical protein